MIKLLLLLFSGLKYLKFGKLLMTGGTMLLSIVLYAFVYGWRYAVGIVALLFVHEMGHYVAARRRGLDVGAPTFIPFVGAWVELKQRPHNAETEAYVGLAGPLVGTLGALACYFVARDTHTDWLLAVAYSGLFINLINLIPILPFDGGRVTQVISPWLWVVGAPLLVLLFLQSHSPLLLFIAALGAFEAWHLWRRRNEPEMVAYRVASAETRITYAMAYLGLAGFLAVMTHDVHEMLQVARVGSGSV
jgi:Zn-dependent protease